MPTAGTCEQLLAQRVLMINPSPQLLAAIRELENSPLGKPSRFDHLVSDDCWAAMLMDHALQHRLQLELAPIRVGR